MKVADSDGASDTDSENVQVSPTSPTCTDGHRAGGQTANEGASTTFDLGSFTDPGPDAPWHVDVDWGDGSAHATFAETTGIARHARATPTPTAGRYTVTVKVTDKDGGYDTKTFPVTVSNVAPTATAAYERPRTRASRRASGSAQFSDPGADRPVGCHRYTWDDGSPDDCRRTPPRSRQHELHAYDDNGVYTVTVTVTDKDGGQRHVHATVTVDNVAPTATPGQQRPDQRGRDRDGLIHAPRPTVAADTAAGFHYDFQLQRQRLGAAPRLRHGRHERLDDLRVRRQRHQTVRARIIDKDNGATEYTTDRRRQQRAAGGHGAGRPDRHRGHLRQLRPRLVHRRNASDGDWTVDVDWGDSGAHTTFTKTAMGAMGTKSHTYADNGTYTVSVNVTDKDGGKSTKTFKILVGNVKPTITSFTATDYLAGPNAFITGGNPLSRLTTTFTDPGSDLWTALFTYQDGAPTDADARPTVPHRQPDHPHVHDSTAARRRPSRSPTTMALSTRRPPRSTSAPAPSSRR